MRIDAMNLRRLIVLLFAVVPLCAGASRPGIRSAWYYRVPADSVWFAGKPLVSSSYLELESDRKLRGPLNIELFAGDGGVVWKERTRGEHITQIRRKADGRYNVFIALPELRQYPASVSVEGGNGAKFATTLRYHSLDYTVGSAGGGDLYIGVVPNGFDDPEIIYHIGGGVGETSGTIILPDRKISRMYAASDKYGVSDLEDWFINFQPIGDSSTVRFQTGDIEVYDLACALNGDGGLSATFRPMRLERPSVGSVEVGGKKYRLFDFQMGLGKENVEVFVNEVRLDVISCEGYYETHKKGVATRAFRVETGKIEAKTGDIVKVAVNFRGLCGRACFMLR